VTNVGRDRWSPSKHFVHISSSFCYFELLNLVLVQICRDVLFYSTYLLITSKTSLGANHHAHADARAFYLNIFLYQFTTSCNLVWFTNSQKNLIDQHYGINNVQLELQWLYPVGFHRLPKKRWNMITIVRIKVIRQKG